MTTRREISDHVRALIVEVRSSLDDLTYDPTGLTHGRGTLGTVIRTKSGTLIGQISDETAATMIVEAPRWLRLLAAYVERLEGEAYSARAERRRFRMVTQALRNAEGAGIGTPTGQRHIEAALERLHSTTDD